MNFIIGFICGILAFWMAYRVNKILTNVPLWNEEVIEEESDEETDPT